MQASCTFSTRVHMLCTSCMLPQDEYSQRITVLRQRAGELKVWAAWQDLPRELEEPMFRWGVGRLLLLCCCCYRCCCCCHSQRLCVCQGCS
jgi:hypothetical protein